jgi:transcription elongation factor GreA
MEYRIVGTTEADISAGKISNESPLGKALMGKKVGEIARVAAPNGAVIEYEILEIK